MDASLCAGKFGPERWLEHHAPVEWWIVLIVLSSGLGNYRLNSLEICYYVVKDAVTFASTVVSRKGSLADSVKGASQVQFYVINQRESPPHDALYPFVVLVTDGWNDYGYETLFHPVIHLSRDENVNLDNVKILKLGQEGGRTEVKPVFEQLDESYCSLGQELAYYEMLLDLSPEIRSAYLTAIRDAAADPVVRLRFEDTNGFRTSLLRWGTAERALKDAPAILIDGIEGYDGYESTVVPDMDFTFHTKLGSNVFATDFRFSKVDGLPGRVNAIIGYNGTGKTQLLANLAWVARADLRSRQSESRIAKYGHLDPKDIRFGRVVAVSYSAFDTFELPKSEGQLEDFGYTYCGLRRPENTSRALGLKEPGEITKEIEEAIKRIATPNRRNSLKNALKPLMNEPSFSRNGHKLDFLSSDGGWREEFNSLSSGHKISVNIIVQLVSALQQRSLVLIDEPESHLHPPLLAALMKGIGVALESHNSYAVLATHSPVVLQEIAGCYTHVLRRHGTSNSVEKPEIETFGENIGILTRHVFNLDNSQSDYVGALRKLASDFSLEQIEELFVNGLSSQARALVMQEKRD